MRHRIKIEIFGRNKLVASIWEIKESNYWTEFILPERIMPGLAL